MGQDKSIVILEGGRRTPRADILINNKEPGLFSRYSTTQLGGMAIKATLENTDVDPGLIGHVVMGMAQHSHRDSIYGAQGMRWRGGLPNDVPALTVARICGSGAEAIAIDRSNVSARANLIGTVRYTLTELETGKVVDRGETTNFTGYSTFDTPIVTRAAERDAEKRLMQMLADQMLTRLVASAASRSR